MNLNSIDKDFMVKDIMNKHININLNRNCSQNKRQLQIINFEISFQFYQYHSCSFFFQKNEMDRKNDPEVQAELRFQQTHRYVKYKPIYWRTDEYGRIENPFIPRWFRRVFLDYDPSAPDYFVLDVFYRIYKLFWYMYKSYENYKKKMELLGKALDWKYGYRDWWKWHREAGIRRRRPQDFDLYNQHKFHFDWKGNDPYAKVGIFEMYFWNIIHPYLTQKPTPWGLLPQARVWFGWDRWNPWMNHHLTPEEIEYYRQWHPQALRSKGFDVTSYQNWGHKQLIKYCTPQLVYKNPKYMSYPPKQTTTSVSSSFSWSNNLYNLLSSDNIFHYFYMFYNFKFFYTSIFILFVFIFFLMTFLIIKIHQDRRRILNWKNQSIEMDQDLTAYEMMERLCIQHPFKKSIFSSQFFGILWIRFWRWISEYGCIIFLFCFFDNTIFFIFNYLYWFYSTFELTCTILFLFLFLYLSIRYYRQYKKNVQSARLLYKLYDFPFSAFKFIYFFWLFISQVIKLYLKFLQDRETFWEYHPVWRHDYDWEYESHLSHWYYVCDWINYEYIRDIWAFILLIHIIFIVWYLNVEHCDWWMGWNTVMPKKTYDRNHYEHRNYWNFKNAHWRMAKFKFYRSIVKWMIIMCLPFFIIGRYISGYIFRWFLDLNSIYIKTYNYFFGWRKKKYTFREIQQQWEKDKVQLHQLKHQKKNSKKKNEGGGLRIS